jgi:hypothetical protein
MDTSISGHKGHLVARIREALAEDPRLNELDIQVTITAGKVFLLGEVNSEERRRIATQVAAEIIPDDMELVNDLWVAHYKESPETERLR